MFSAKTFLLFVAAAASPLATALAENGTVEAADFWAMFCDDTECSQNCGQSVQVSNPGCLNQNGRQSIRFHGGDVGSGDYSLVISPSGDCPCQESCSSIPTNTECWDISRFQDAKSFRFIGGHCDGNNC
ncbi:uncharacterized protein F4812DRAFT_446287 [Daldinia caldariorum]|uniref:uncharacterized protein n=1 Tax=Daldinia caldariorum TaxID=326644 RepID=UPI0020072E68|nr:uncharacterized protein F4812DRAFT_446287 [Daldinia caldariorum]KAI1463478.1 hypothetical protein F4812DRAFT_446287 [Daldinia caldariorum]